MIIYAIVMLIVLPAAAFAFGLCRAAAKPAPKPTLADMLARTPKILRTNTGRRIYAEGRPTMPSQAEPMDEQARRRAPIRYPHRNAYDTRPCECEYCMEPTLRDTGEVDPLSLR